MRSAQVGTLPSKKRILIVDDEDLVRWYLREKLQEGGFEVIEAASGAAAVGELAGDPVAVDLVLVDHLLPDMNGLQVLRSNRATHTPAILMTAYATPEIVAQAKELGAAAVLLKPFGMNALLACVRGALQGAAYPASGPGEG